MFPTLPFSNVSLTTFSANIDSDTFGFNPDIYHKELAGFEPNSPRRDEFLRGRQVAHTTLRKSGAALSSSCRIGRDSFGAPQWPVGWTGSISHSKDKFIAACVSTSDYLSIGIDIETARGPGLARAINRLCVVDGDAAHDNLTVLFSAKEAIYKAVHPIYGGHLWFTDFVVSHIGDDGYFRWSFLPCPGITGEGYFVASDDLVLTCVTLPCDHALARHKVKVPSLRSIPCH